MTFTLVSFHAHPDDEALLTAGTLARAAAEGHRVVLVVATAGGAGLASSEVLAEGPLAPRRRSGAPGSSASATRTPGWRTPRRARPARSPAPTRRRRRCGWPSCCGR